MKRRNIDLSADANDVLESVPQEVSAELTDTTQRLSSLFPSLSLSRYECSSLRWLV